MANRRTSWPTEQGSVFFDDAGASRTLARAVSEGEVRRIVPGVFTADLHADPALLVQRHRWRILGRLLPGAVIADRSAANDARPEEGQLWVIFSDRNERRPLELPGLTVRTRPGPPALEDDLPFPEGLWATSHARTLLDNLADSRARSGLPRTLRREELEAWLVTKAQRLPEQWLRTLRNDIERIAPMIGAEDRVEAAVEMIGMVGGTRPVRKNASPLLVASAQGTAWDPDRLQRFTELAAYLARDDLDLDIPNSLSEPNDIGFMPFFESYFSNYIEGTMFPLEVAEEIVETQEVPRNRPEDGHDILGTYRIVADPIGRAVVAGDFDEFVRRLKVRHRAIMEGRPEKRPGEFKEEANQAGSYVFVAPEQVEGTLARGFALAADVPAGFRRALYMLFLVSEVHPFDDGNGRLARAVANAELSAVGECRTLIPIVWRNEYMKALREVSRHGKFDLYIRTIAHAWRWTALIPWNDRPALDAALQMTNALLDSTDAENDGVQLTLP